MLKRYSPEQLVEFAAYYERHGVVRLPGLIPGETAAMLLQQVDYVAANIGAFQKVDSPLSSARDKGRLAIRYMWRGVPAVREFLLHPDLADPVARIVGTESLRFWFDVTIFHNGDNDGHQGVGTGWHHDISGFAFKGEKMPSLWMALTPADAAHSRLMFVDGSHRDRGGFYRPKTTKHYRLEAMNVTSRDVSDGFRDVPDFDYLIATGVEKCLTWDCEPGDAFIIHPFTVHSAHGNADTSGANRRVAMTTRWLGDDARFLPLDAAKAAHMPGMEDRRLALGAKPEGEWFPETWNRSSQTAPQLKKF